MDMNVMSQIRLSYLALFLWTAQHRRTYNGFIKRQSEKIILQIPDTITWKCHGYVYLYTDRCDRHWKGVGADALAALSITTPLLCILMSTGILFGVGGSVQMSVHRGSGNHQKSNRYFTISFSWLRLLLPFYGWSMPPACLSCFIWWEQMTPYSHTPCPTCVISTFSFRLLYFQIM